jgi:hypothetical protein
MSMGEKTKRISNSILADAKVKRLLRPPLRRCETTAFLLRIPKEWWNELNAARREMSIRKQKRFTVQDLVRVAILEKFFMLEGERLPDYPTLKPYRVGRFPKL